MRIVEAFAEQARGCEALGSPMYAELLRGLVADLEAGGPTAAVLAGHENDSGPSALALRLLGSVHRLVLERRAGALAAYYPSVGGTWRGRDGTAAFVALLAEQPEAVREWLDQPPQTNEVGRSAALMGGLLHLDGRPVRLAEIGASGGLNLLADRYAYTDGTGAVYGHSPVVLAPAWKGSTPTWRPLEVVERLGCDVAPLDVGSTRGRLALTAYVWPDQVARHERLRGALALAQEVRPEVRAQGAADFVDGLELRAGTTTVLWHSVMWQYLPHDEQARVTARIEELGRGAGDDAGFAHLRLEPTRRTPEGRHEFLVSLTTYPDGARRVLGRAAPHGLPVTWEA